MTIRFCDELGEQGFSWIVDEANTRTSHALAADRRVWLVDPVTWPAALERVRSLGEPVAVLQLLDRHNRDCASIASELGIPHLVAPAALPDAPFEVIDVKRSRRWQEIALWWPAPRTLVVAEAIGTNPFYTGGHATAGVHLLLRMTPPRSQLEGLEPEHLLVGHGEGLHGVAAAAGLRDALDRARTGLPSVGLKIPSLMLDAGRRRR